MKTKSYNSLAYTGNFERFRTLEDAERRAAYLRIGTFKNAFVKDCGTCYEVHKRK